MNMSTAQISFVVPVYNVKPYLERCLESIIRTNVEKEIILIDDGSTDGSREILEQYQQKYSYITLVCQSNKGVSAARNVGIKLAKGKYIQFVDSDDFLLAENYSQFISLADNNDISIFRAQYQRIIGNKVSNGNPVLEFPNNSSIHICFGSHFLKEMNRKASFLPFNVLGFYLTELLHKHHILFNEDLSIAEDAIFVFELLSATENIKVMEVLQPLYAYVLRENSCIASISAKKITDLFSAANILWNKYHHYKQENNESICDSLLRIILFQYHNAYYFYKNADNETKHSTKYLFTKNVISSLESSYKYKVDL